MRSLRLDFTYIEFPENLGFAGGANAGIWKALEEGFSHIALLNNDTEVRPNFADQVSRATAICPDRIIAGLVLNKADGLPGSNIGRISKLNLSIEFIYAETVDGNIDFVSGCFVVFPREVVEKSGLFNDTYFMYCEDAELCLRWKRLGFQIRFFPEIEVVHAANSTTDRAGTPKEYYRMRNQTRMVLKYGSASQKTFYAVHLILLLAYKLRHPRIFVEFCKGIRDALTNRMGKRRERSLR